jgi:hypothetical protein
MQKWYKLPVTWEVSGFVEIEAHSIEQAISFFKKYTEDIELPEEMYYVDGSFRLIDDDVEIIKLYNN